MAAEDTVRYSRDIRPILSENCYACHGPDENKRKARLRLDTREGATGELRRGRRAVVPGDLDASQLIARVTADDEFDRMPPPETGKHLTAEQIDLLRRWVQQGARFDTHWSYAKPRRPAVPEVKHHAGRVRNPIDAFVFARLEEKGLSASRAADRRTLIRRLSFDLTGLPPKPAEVEAFIADESPEAYGGLVDRLLSAPHYGERMAMYWLDLVRYADTTGIHGDNHREVSAYRDYVIDAFNDNKPFQWFTIEQIAGDLLPDPTAEQRVASGYNRLLMTTQEGGAQPKEYRAKYDADRVRNVSSVWLGSTIGCAQCHDHKYDPFATREFYSLAAFFADIKEVEVGEQPPNLRLPTGVQRAELQRLDGLLARTGRELDTQTPELEKAQAEWERGLRESPPKWTILTPLVASSSGGSTLRVEPVGSVSVSGEVPQRDDYIIAARTSLPNLTAVRLEVLPDDRLPGKGPGRAGNGNFVLNELKVFAAPADRPGDLRPIALQNPSADFSQKGLPITNAIDGDVNSGWAISPETGKAHQAVFEIASDVASAEGTLLTFSFDHRHGLSHNIGRFRLAVTDRPRPVRADDADEPPSETRDILAIAPGERSAEQRAHVAAYFRTVTPLLKATRERHASLKEERDRVEASVRTMLATERIPEPRVMRVLVRGNWLDESGPVVQPAVPAALSPLPPKRGTGILPVNHGLEGRATAGRATAGRATEGRGTGILPVNHGLEGRATGGGATGGGATAGGATGGRATQNRPDRMDLARWLTSADNPLVARVFVNRLWKILLGRGLVATLDDFGSQGTWPTHPELLDWLAMEFIDRGWDVKHVVRLIAMSETYRLSSNGSAEAVQRDPINQFLARQNAFRLPAESVRDNALSISGLLNLELGGRSVKPYQPAGYWSHLNFPKRTYEPDTGPALYRRGLYTYWCRTFLQPNLAAFDAPTREECTVERTRSNTPLQALVLLNDPVYVEAARALAVRILREGGDTFEERLAFAYRVALNRAVRPAEEDVFKALCRKHRDEYEKKPEDAAALLSIGEYVAPEGLGRAELAAWTSAARTILNLHETITRY